MVCHNALQSNRRLWHAHIHLIHWVFLTAHFHVNKHNERVFRFHVRFGATRIEENAVEYEYIISSEAIRTSM